MARFVGGVVRVAPVAAAILVVAGCGGAPPTGGAQSASAVSSRPCGGSASGASTVTTARYVITLVVGPVEAMYSQADVSARHPKSGEVMVRGEMVVQGGTSSMGGMTMGGSAPNGMSSSGSGMSGMSTSGASMNGMNMSGPSTSTSAAPSARTVVSRIRHLEVHICAQSGAVVTDANPSIHLRDTTDGTSVDVPVAVMEGVTSGPSDLHYGNNISLTSGHSYAADVGLDGVGATFHLPA